MRCMYCLTNTYRYQGGVGAKIMLYITCKMNLKSHTLKALHAWQVTIKMYQGSEVVLGHRRKGKHIFSHFGKFLEMFFICSSFNISKLFKKFPAGYELCCVQCNMAVWNEYLGLLFLLQSFEICIGFSIKLTILTSA